MSPQSRKSARSNSTRAGDNKAPIPFRSGRAKPVPAGAVGAQGSLDQDLELLARLREQIDQVPDIDAAKIVELHARIVRGEYRIDSRRIADKLQILEADLDG